MDSPIFQGPVGATSSQPHLVLPGKAFPMPATAGVTTNQYPRATAVQAFTIPCFGKQRQGTAPKQKRSAGQPQACPHHVPGAGQHQAQMLSPSNSTDCPAPPPEMPGKEAAAPGLSTPEEDLDTRTRTQISGGGIDHSDHVGPSTPGTPHGSHLSPTPNMTLPADKSVQARLVEPCLCPAHPRGKSSLPPSFPGQEGALQGISSLPPMIQKQKLEGKDKSACHRIQRHKVVECTRLR